MKLLESLQGFLGGGRGARAKRACSGSPLLMSKQDYDELEEIAHLLRSPANAIRLIESLKQALTGDRYEHDLEQ